MTGAPGGVKPGRGDAVLLAFALAFTAAVYLPLTQNYFHTDDFLNLYQILNEPLPTYLLTPHGGHVLLTRNALRRARSCVPNAFSSAVLWVIGRGDFGDMCFQFCSK